MSNRVKELKARIDALGLELDDIKSQLDDEPEEKVRLLHDEVRDGDWVTYDGAAQKIVHPNNWSSEFETGDIWPTEELCDRELKWSKARASLIREISRLNGGVEADPKSYYAPYINCDEDIQTYHQTYPYQIEPLLMLKAEPSPEDLLRLKPYFLTYVGIDK